MANETKNALVNIEGKAAEVLVEKLDRAGGGLFAPWQIKRVARANREAAQIKAEADIKIDEMQQLAMHSMIAREIEFRRNIVAITEMALPQLGAGADTEAVDDDWITNFFEKARIISSKEMQGLWSRVLAGEANIPGAFSRRTVNFIADLDKS